LVLKRLTDKIFVMLRPQIKHKFRAKPTELNGVRYDSKLEASYAAKLELAKKSGELLFYLRQVPIDLPGNTKYRVDFLEFWADGNVYFVDCKGYETETFRLKLRQVTELYPIEIKIVTKA